MRDAVTPLFLRRLSSAQVLAATMTTAPRLELSRSLSDLVQSGDIALPLAERIIFHQVIGQIVAKAAFFTHVAALPEVQTALVSLQSISASSDEWFQETRKHIMTCADAVVDSAWVAPVTKWSHCRPVRLIDERFEDPRLSIAVIGAACEMSPSHVSRVVRRATGATVLTRIHSNRVAAARHHLQYSSKSIKEIAALVGYSSSTQLERHFRQSVGVTPVDFRKGVSNVFTACHELPTKSTIR